MTTTTTIPLMDLGLWTNAQWYPVLVTADVKVLLDNRQTDERRLHGA